MPAAATDSTSPPRAISLIGSYEPEVQPAFLDNVVVTGTTAYLSDSHNGIRVLDISNPVQPTSVMTLAGYTAEPSMRSLAAAGNQLYATKAGQLFIFDISTPHAPVEIGRYESPMPERTPSACIAMASSVHVAGQYAYLGFGALGSYEPCPGSLQVLDVSQPSQPTRVGVLTGLTGTISAMDLVWPYLYATQTGMTCGRYCHSRGQLHVIDVSDPTSPKLLHGTPLELNQVTGVSVRGDRVYVTGGLTFDSSPIHAPTPLYVFDISNPVSPTPVITAQTSFVRVSQLAGPYLVIAEPRFESVNGVEYEGGIRILDTTDPLTLTEVATTTVTTLDLAIGCDGIYVTQGPDGLKVLGVSDAPPATEPITATPVISLTRRFTVTLPLVTYQACGYQQ